ncbi:Ig-like domain-containing protein [Hymenobacter sp. B81]|uniref:Ig-like domain-containing protein n=1 Tax=Hymenobacter sp. B81 TaxID=3344878 RepID=UPI0037DDA07B
MQKPYATRPDTRGARLSSNSAPGESASRGGQWRRLLLGVGLWAGALAAHGQGASKLYWVQSSATASSDALVVANLDGSNPTVLASGAANFANPLNIAVNVAAGHIYVADANATGGTGITRYNLDGSGRTAIAAHNSGWQYNDLQVAGGKLYWVQSSGTASSDALVVANLDGSNPTVLASGAANFANPTNLAVDAVAGYIYVADANVTGNTGITRYNLDGSGRTAIAAPATGVQYNDLQALNNKLYWVQSSATASSDALVVANLDGSNSTVLASGAANFANPLNLAINTASGVIYVADANATGGTGITRYNLDGSGRTAIAAHNSGWQYNELVLDEQVATSVSSINRVGAATTNAASVSFTVTFAQSISGLSTGNFSLTTSGLSGASVSSVSGSGSTYTVTVNTGSGDGTVRLNLQNASGLSAPVTGLPYTSGQTYTIDKTAPVVTGVTGGATYNSSRTISFNEGTATLNGSAFASGGSVSGTGSYTLVVTDAAGNVTTVGFSIDTTAPNTFIVSGPPALTNSPSATFDFSSDESGVSYQASLDGSAFGAVTDPMTFVGLSSGPHSLAVRAIDAAGNVDATPATYSWTIDAVAPAAPVAIAPANGSVTGDNTPTFVGTAEPGSTVTVIVDGSSVGTTTTTGSGNWALNQPSALADGSHTVRATATDAAGNTSPSSNTNTFMVDATAPAAPVVSSPANGLQTADNTPTYSGTAESGSTITVVVDGSAVGTTTTSGAGSWSFTQAVALAEGSHTVRATATDAAGNLSPLSSTNTFVVDTQAPNTLIVSGPPALTNSPSATFDFSSNESGVSYQASLDGSAFTSATDPVTFSGLADGLHTLAVRAIDGAGNVDATPATYSWTIDAVAPAAPVAIAPANGSITGDNTPAYSGTGEPGSTVTVIVDGISVGTTTANGAGNWVFTPVTPLAEGSHTVRATAADAAGNTSPSSNTNTFTVDTQAPAAPVVAGPANGSTTGDNTPTYSGTGEPGSTITVVVDGSAVGTTTVSGGGSWSFTQPTALAEGSHTVRATATDVVGNVSVSSNTNSFVVDAQAPNTLIVSGPPALTNSSSATFDFSSNESGVSYQASLDGAPFTSATDPVTFSSLADGAHTLEVRAIDAAGNVDATPASYSWTIDTQAPTVALASPASNPTATSPIPVTVTFSESVSGFSLADLVVGNATAANFSGSGSSYSFTLTPTGPGLVTVNIGGNSAVDAAGNGNVAASPFSIQYSPLPSVLTWTGGASTNWNSAANWSPAQVPAADDNVLVPAGAPRYPVLAGGAFEAHNLTLEAGATLSQSGGTLEVAGAFVNNGTLNATGGTIALSDTVAQTIGGSSTSRFFNLAVGGAGAQLAGPVQVQRLLTLDGSLNTNGQAFTLLSDADGTAMVVNRGGTVNGTATVQRYITPALNPGPGYRHYSAPVSNTTVADLATPGFTPVVNPQYNSSPNPGLVTPYPTVFGYNESRLTGSSATTAGFDFGWESPTALSSPLLRGRGYTVNIPASQTVDFVGTLNNGDVPVGPLTRGATANSGWHLLGNPYPSPIDWDSLARPAGMMNAVYVYRSNGQYSGSYASYVNGIGSLSGGVIGAMQGFFVRTTQDVPAFSFQNAARLSTYADPAFYRGAATEQRPVVQLSATHALSQQQDEAFVYLQPGASPAVEAAHDAVKLPAGPVRLYTLAGTEALAINGLAPAATQQVPLVIEGAAGNWQLSVAQLLNATDLSVELEDRVRGLRQPLSAGSQYAFAHSGGHSGTRFVLHLNASRVLAQKAANTLAADVYPNPTRNGQGLRISASGLSSQPLQLALYNSLGQRVASQEARPQGGTVRETLVTQHLPAGVYTLRLTSGTQQTVKKVVVE